jgi:quinol monooxygenase YgiN
MRAAALASFALVALARPGFAQVKADGFYEAMPAGAYAVVAEVRAKKGMEAELRQAPLPLVAMVRNEPNNLLYFLHKDRESPGRFVFYEIFASKADFEAHNRTAHVRAWFAKLPALADGDVKVMHLEALGNGLSLAQGGRRP